MKSIIKKIMIWLVNRPYLSIPRRLFVKLILATSEGQLISIDNFWKWKGNFDNEMPIIKSIIKVIKTETTFLLTDWEALQLYLAVKKTQKINGNIAEVGVFKGGSASLIAKANTTCKKIYLFDTFDGLPDLNTFDNSTQFYSGQFKSSYDEVKEYLSKYENINIHKGYFPSTSKPIENELFSFVHLDVDLYETTLECLKFFYPRMTKGAILISHDYTWAIGVRKAFNDFFSDKPEPIIELDFIGSQCLIVKT
jgi:O-methyltransferase